MKNSNRITFTLGLVFTLLFSLIMPAFAGVQAKAATKTSDLIISEYVEGSSFNKAIELYNGTGGSVNLNNYSIEIFMNGKTIAEKPLNLTGTLKNGETYVIYHKDANADIKSKGNLSDSVIANFNGDDIIVLKKSDVVIDSIGQIGSLDKWGVDCTLVRNSNVINGDLNPNDSFDSTKEWTKLPKDNTSNLGIHFIDDSEPPIENKVETVTASIGSSHVTKDTEVSLSTKTEGATIHYTTDGTDPTGISSLYKNPIKIDKNTTIKAIAIKDGLTNSSISTFEYKIIESLPIQEVRKLSDGEVAMTTGIVTATFGSPVNTVYIQDDSAGIVLYGTGQNVEIGDRVQVKGKLTQFQNLLELEVIASDVTVIEKTTIPIPEIVTPDQLQEDKEAMLLTLENVKIDSADGQNFTASTDDGSFVIRPNDSSLLTVGATYDSITGVLGQYKNTYQLIPRNADDITVDATKVQPIVATPGSGFIKGGDKIALSTNTNGATIHYTVNGDEPTTTSSVYSEPITINNETTIKAIAVKTGLANSPIATFKYSIMDKMRIHHLQGTGHTSTFKDKNVTDIEGIVTYVKDSSNFYMQDLQPDNDIKTSEGILVNKSTHSVKIGDVVTVTGTVEEFVNEGYADKATTDLSITRIKASALTKKQSDQPLPTPIVIGKDRIAPSEIIDNDSFTNFDPEEDGIDFYESLEGMYVKIDNPKVVAPQAYGDIIVVPGEVKTNTNAGGLKITAEDYNPERITIDLNNTSFVAKTGDYFNGSFEGVVSYGYSNFMIMPNKDKLPALIEGKTTPEITSIEKNNNKLNIATYNIENYSSKTSAEKTTKIAQSIIKNLKQPDIIELTEVQDSDGETDSGNTSANESYQTLINKISALGGKTYKYTDIAPANNQDGGAPGGNIRVGFLYDPERVTLTDGIDKGTATQAVNYDGKNLSLNPGRIDPTNEAFSSSRKPLAAQFEFKGEKVILIANHFNSKGGDQPLFGKNQPPVLSSEVQRNKIATIVNAFVKDIKVKNSNANVVVLGDLNDFEFSKPLEILKGNVLTNMIEKVPFDKRYTYSYQGNSQVLDHMLVSNNMATETQVDIVHINSSFMEEHGRASDHDPVLIQTTLQSTKDTYAKTYHLTNYKSKKLSINKTNSFVTLSTDSTITEGITLKASATLIGEGLAKTKIILDAKNMNSFVDFQGSTVQEVVIENANINTIKGAENVKKWVVKDGVDVSNIQFFTNKGTEMTSPLLPSTPPTNTDDYYSNAEGKTGKELKSALHNIIKGHTQLAYGDVTNALKETDKDPNNPNNVILLYTGRSQSKDTFVGSTNNQDAWNKEHVWAKSHGDFGTSKGPGTDLHHLRPEDVSVNSSRGHLDFDNGGKPHSEATDNKYDSDSWEPADRVKGDVARMIFYMAVRYEGTNGEIDLELANEVNTYPKPLHGKLSVLLEWNKLDPVDNFERKRNEVIYKDYQHNRNPFIDHPNWADKIWGQAI